MQVLPGARIVIVRCEGAPAVCRTDEVGEILVHSPATASSYWGLPGLTQSAFKVRAILFCSFHRKIFHRYFTALGAA